MPEELPKVRKLRDVADLEAALDTLVASGVLEKRVLPDGTAVYFSRVSKAPRC